jgi:hypothetical protein
LINLVPYNDKTGELEYDAMIPGMYYFDPDTGSLYTRDVPPSESDEGGFYIINPTTYEKRKLQKFQIGRLYDTEI